MKAQLITPEKILFEGDVEMITAPGVEGDFGVLPGHMNFISTLRPGAVVLNFADGTKQEIEVTGGVAEVTADHCTLLIDAA